MSWGPEQERQHPRDQAGRFTSALHWRVFETSLSPRLVPGDDPHNATQQIRASEENYRGLGRWWGRDEGDDETHGRELAAFYAAPSSVLVGVRMRPEDAAAMHDPEDSGLYARQPTQVLVEQVHVMEENGTWTQLDVPAGLTSWTHGIPDPNAWAGEVNRRLPGGSIYDTFTHPEFSDPSDDQRDQAEQWARGKFDYTDRTTGYRSEVTSIDHSGDGFTAYGEFVDGQATIGHWEIGILNDEDTGGRAMVVEGIEIDPDRRGEGLAKRWVQRLEAAGRAEGVERISMWDMSGGFWERMGYTRDRRGTGEKTL